MGGVGGQRGTKRPFSNRPLPQTERAPLGRTMSQPLRSPLGSDWPPALRFLEMLCWGSCFPFP